MLERFRSKLPKFIRNSRIWEKPTPKAQKRLAFEQKLVFKNKKKKLPNIRQLRYISSFFSARERVTVMFSVVLMIGGVIWGGYVAYAQYVDEVPAKGGSYREALIGSPLYVNPILANTNDVDLDLVSLIYSGLLRKDKNQKFKPELAQSYNISEDKTTYTVTLRQGLTWHDGQPLTADDVVFTYRAMKEPAVNSPLYASMQDVTIEKVDERTVKFNLEEPFSPFISVLTTGIIPQHLWANLPASNIRLAELNIKPVGAGPWKFEKLEKDKQGNIHSYTLVPFEQYHLQKPFIEELTFQFFDDFGTAVEAFNNTSVEGISYLPRQLAGQVSQTLNYQTRHLQLPQYTSVFFQRENNDALSSNNLRKALAYSIDRERLLQAALGGHGTIIDGPLSPDKPGDNENLDGYEFDPVRAKTLLDEVGWESISAEEYVTFMQEQQNEERGSEGEEAEGTDTAQQNSGQIINPGNQAVFRKKDDEILSITLTTVDQPEHMRAAEIIRDAWQTIGIDVEIETITTNVFLSDVLPARDYEALLYAQVLNTPPDLYSFWHSSQSQAPGLNITGYADDEVDEWLSQARQTTGQARAEAYTNVQQRLIEDVPAIFLYSPQYTYILPEKINGFDLEKIGTPSDRFKNLHDWYIETRHVLKD